MEITRKLLVVLLIAFASIAICQAQGRGNGRGNARNNRNNGNKASQNTSTSTEDTGSGGRLAADEDEDDDLGAAEIAPQDHRNSCRGRWERWSLWSLCNAACNQRGKQTRHRDCVERRNRPCNNGFKPQCNGRYQKERACYGTCGGGNVPTTTTFPFSTRTFRSTLPANRNDPCAPGLRQGEWGDWGCWSQTCVYGARVRYRQCNEPVPVGPNMYCRGSAQDSQTCFVSTTEDPSTPTPCVAGQDIIFAVDASGSIGITDFDSMTNNLLSLIRNFDLDYPGNTDPKRVRAGILTFSDSADSIKELNNFNIPTDLQYVAGATNTHDALDLAQTMFTPANGDRIQNRNTLVVLTDGQSTDRTRTLSAAARAKATGIKIIAVGIGQNVDQSELQSMVTDPNTDVYPVDDFSQLGTKLTELFGCT